MAILRGEWPFNLDQRQKETVRIYPEFRQMPVLYFTQLMAIALGSLAFGAMSIIPNTLPILITFGVWAEE